MICNAKKLNVHIKISFLFISMNKYIFAYHLGALRGQAPAAGGAAYVHIAALGGHIPPEWSYSGLSIFLSFVPSVFSTT